jgi:hypothetical protein
MEDDFCVKCVSWFLFSLKKPCRYAIVQLDIDAYDDTIVDDMSFMRLLHLEENVDVCCSSWVCIRDDGWRVAMLTMGEIITTHFVLCSVHPRIYYLTPLKGFHHFVFAINVFRIF